MKGVIVGLVSAVLCGCAGDLPQVAPPAAGSTAAPAVNANCDTTSTQSAGVNLTPNTQVSLSQRGSSAAMTPLRPPCAKPEPEAKAAVLAAAASDLSLGQAADTAAITIAFEPNEVDLSPANRKRLTTVFEKHSAKGLKEVRILAGCGSYGNLFERLIVSQKRIHFVRKILPKGMVLEAEYDPSENDDTLRIELVGDHSSIE